MNGKEFAEKFAGRRVQIFDTIDVPRRNINPQPYARVIGYYNLSYVSQADVLVDFEEEDDQTCAWHIDTSIYDITLTVQDAVRGWRVPIHNLRLMDCYAKHHRVHKPVVAYPHVCVKCKYPARKNGQVMLCSNTRCKSRLGYLRQVKRITAPGD